MRINDERCGDDRSGRAVGGVTASELAAAVAV
jgi:hypothetical protein